MTKHGAIRVLILSLFGAAGVGLAVSLAVHTRPENVPEADHVATGPPTTSTEHSGTRTQIDSAVQSTSAELPAATAQHAHVLPAVAGPSVDDLMELLKSMSEQNRGVLDAARDMLQQGQVPAAPTAPAVQPPDAPLTGESEDLPPPHDTETTITDEGDNRLTITIRDEAIPAVLEALSVQTGMNILAMPGATGTISATLNNVDGITALMQLAKNAGLAVRKEGDFYYVGTPQEIEQLRRSHERMVTRIYRPNYVTAAELLKLVTPILSQGGQATLSASSTVAAAGASQSSGSSQIAVSTPTLKGIAASTDQTGSDDFAGMEVLLVRDYESVLHYVDQIVTEVDQRPAQLALESMILSVRLDDENSLGVNLELLRNKENVRLVSGVPIEDLATIDFSEGGLKFGFLDSSVGSLIAALETIGDTNVIASPRLMCLNKQRAEILIGSQLGYVNTIVTETAATQSVEFLEVGTQLRFRPYIASDGLIRLEVHPELSTGNVRVEDGVTLPDKDVTQVTTNIMCHDGCTVIIGGLIREDLTTNGTRIPMLGSLPMVGALFRFHRETMDRREIIVLLTPHIVCDPVDYKEASDIQTQFLQRQENFADKMSIVGRRHYGMHYLRYARAAWNAGDFEGALCYVNMSIHLDPMNREATTLHRQILAQLPPGTDTIHSHLRQGFNPLHHPRVDYSKRGVPWQVTEMPPSDIPPDPDPGQTGPRHDLEPVHIAPPIQDQRP